jgi:two-component system cell cycle response regulator DivK
MSDQKTILHIEDNPENRLLVKRLLESAGYAVLEAENGNLALELLKTSLPDLILVDINMPDLDGYTLTGMIRENPDFLELPIVALTANVIKGTREKTYQAGCTGYIEKPIDIDDFLVQIQELLDHK